MELLASLLFSQVFSLNTERDSEEDPRILVNAQNLKENGALQRSLATAWHVALDHQLRLEAMPWRVICPDEVLLPTAEHFGTLPPRLWVMGEESDETTEWEGNPDGIDIIVAEAFDPELLQQYAILRERGQLAAISTLIVCDDWVRGIEEFSGLYAHGKGVDSPAIASLYRESVILGHMLLGNYAPATETMQ